MWYSHLCVAAISSTTTRENQQVEPRTSTWVPQPRDKRDLHVSPRYRKALLYDPEGDLRAELEEGEAAVVEDTDFKEWARTRKRARLWTP